MITLILLHPFQTVPVQSWCFEDSTTPIKIGRATDNHVVLYSAVVSRYHIELRRQEKFWELVNLGTNGTYLEGKPISKTVLADGMVIHLARSGPKILISFGEKVLDELTAMSADETMAQQVKTNRATEPHHDPNDVTKIPMLTDELNSPPKTQIPL